MKNADLSAMPIELNGFGQYAPEAHIGLTKREMFAMSAMQGICSNPDDRYTYEQLAGHAVKPPLKAYKFEQEENEDLSVDTEDEK